MCRVVHISLFVLLALVAHKNPFAATDLDNAMWTTNGAVYAVEPDVANNRVFVAGRFSRVGQYHGALAVLSEAGSLRNGFPSVNGPVHSVVSDGAGGFFIAGNFTRVGNVNASQVAHIAKNASNQYFVAPDFTIDFNGKVNKLLKHLNVLYIGGSFTQVDGQDRAYLAALNVDGSLTGWNPQLDGEVIDMVNDSNDLYLVGNFNNANVTTTPVSRSHLAAFALDPTVHTPTSWDPNITFDSSFPVFHAITKKSQQIIIGGRFKITVASVLQHRNLMAITDNGVVNSSWKPNPDGRVYALKASTGNGFYVGGEFTSLNNQGVIESQNHLAFFETFNVVGGSGIITTIANGNSNTLTPDNTVYAIEERAITTTTLSPNTVVNDGILYIGGSFGQVNTSGAQRLAAIKITDGSLDSLLTWSSPFIERSVRHLSFFDLANPSPEPVVFTSGDFFVLDGLVRSNIAAFDLTTGVALDWNPSILGGSDATGYGADEAAIYSLKLIDPTTLIAGGKMSQVEGVSISNLVKLHVVPRSTDPNLFDETWLPNPQGTVFALEYNAFSGELYIGGKFQQAGGLTTTHLAKLLLTQSNALSNVASIETFGIINSLALSADSTRLYIGGRFQTVNGIAHSNLAALDTTTETVLPWTFDSDDSIQTISAGPNYVYTAGIFRTLNSVTKGIGKLSTLDSATLPELWGADDVCGQVVTPCLFNATVYATSLDSTNNSVFFGGLFRRLDTELRNYAGLITSFDNILSPWQMSNLRSSEPSVRAMKNQDRLNGSGVLLERILFVGTQTSGLEVYRFVPTRSVVSSSDTTAVPVTVDINCESSPATPCRSIWYNVDNATPVTPGVSNEFTNSFTLTNNGSYEISHMACNTEGICENEQTTTVVINDSSPPSGTISINNDAAATNNSDVSISLNSSDPGIDSYYVDNINTRPDNAVFQSFTTAPVNHTLTAGDGQKTVYVWFKDLAGNVTAANVPAASDDILLDTTPPAVSSINTTPANDSNLRNIIVNLDNYDGTAASYLISDINLLSLPPADPSDSDFTLPAPGNQLSYVLSSSGDGTKVIYVWFVDALGNISPAYTTQINLDTVAPVVNITGPSSEFLNSTNIQLSGTLSDTSATLEILDSLNNPIAAIININGNDWTASFSVGSDQTYTFTARATDAAQNQGTDSISFTVDTIINGQLNINAESSPGPVNSNTVSLDITSNDVSGISGYYISNNSTPPLVSDYIPVTPKQNNFLLHIPAHNLTSDEGNKTVYAWIRDDAGNSSMLSNSILVDSSINASMSINGSSGQISTNNQNLMLEVTSNDASGITAYYISENAATPQDADYTAVIPADINFSLNMPFNLSSGDGTKTIYVWLKDNAGNSIQLNQTVVLDTTISGQFTLNNSTTPAASNNFTVAVEISSNDLSGITAYYIAEDSTPPLDADYVVVNPEENNFIRASNLVLSTGDGNKTVYAWLKDAAGNVQQFSNSILIDTQLTLSLSINGSSNPTATNNNSVALDIQSTDVSGIVAYYVSNTATAPQDADYISVNPKESNFSRNLAHNLTAGEGNKSIYVWLKDEAGNIGSTNNSILFDNSISGTLLLNGSTTPQPINSNSIAVELSSNDVSGIAAYYISNTSTTPADSDYNPVSPKESNFSRTINNYALSANDGNKIVYAWIKDEAGNVVQLNNSVLVDTGITASLTINGSATPSAINTTNVNLNVSSNDASGISAYYLSEDNTAPQQGDYTVVSPQQSIFSLDINNYALSSGDGNKTLYVWLQDLAGNQIQISNTILLDTAINLSIQINGSATPEAINTNTASVDLMATDASGISGYFLSNTNSAPLDSDFIPVLPAMNNFSQNISNHALIAGEGNRTIYAWIRDVAGNVDQASLSVLVDSTINANLLINGNASPNATNNNSVALELNATDSSGITAYYISNDATPPTDLQYTNITAEANFSINIASHSLASGDGNKTVYAWLKDAAGNSTMVSNSILLDTTAPNFSSLQFNDSRINFIENAYYTNSSSVIINFSANDASSTISRYYFGEDNSAHNAANNSAVDVASANLNITDLNINFLNTNNGQKTIYFWLEDDLGNISNSQSLSVSFDNLLSGSIAINGSSTPGTTNNNLVQLNLSSTDLSGITAYYVSTSASTPADNAYTQVAPKEEIFSRQINNFDIGTGDGLKSVFLWLKDAAGNAVQVQNSITLDATAPEISITSHQNNALINSTSILLQGTTSGANNINIDLNGSAQDITPSGSTWSLNLGNLIEGENTITIVASDGLNTSAPLAITLFVDLTPPNTPSGIQPVNDTLIRSNTVLFTGNGEAQSTIQISVDGSLLATSTQAAANGDWQLNVSNLSDGPHSFIFQETDTAGNSSNSLAINLLFDSVNDAPIAQSTVGAILVQQGIAYDGFMAATDAENDGLNFVVLDDVSQGNLVWNADGSFTYTANDDATGNDSFTFQVSDDFDGSTSNIATVSLAINAKPSAPELISPNDGAGAVNATQANFTWSPSIDPDGDAISYELHVCQNSNFDCNPNNIAWWQTQNTVLTAGFGGGSLLIFAFLGASRLVRRYALIVLAILVLSACNGKNKGKTPPPPQQNTPQVSLTLDNLNTSTQYYWKVIAVDARGGRSESVVRTFTTQP